jgi:large subunit ribosomal protein L29
MSRVKLSALRELNHDDLSDRLTDLRAELSKLKSEAAKGTLKKQTGSIRYIRRDVARILTIINEGKMNRNDNG